MGGANYRQKNLLKDLIYLGQTKPVNEQTVKGLFRFALEPILEAQPPRAVVLVRVFDTNGIDGVLKRLEYTNAEVYSFDSITNGENLEKENIWGETEFLIVLSPRYSAVMLWDYSTETSPQKTSCLYYLLNSKNVNNVISIINENSKIDLMRYTQEFTPERRTNELLNNAVHKLINYSDSFVEEAALTKAENEIIGETDDVAQKYEYISSKTRLISHDIKNHLSVIDLYSKIIEKRLEMSENSELQKSVENAVLCIKKAKESVSVLLNELCTIQGVNLKTHDFSKILQNTISMTEAAAQENNVIIKVENAYYGEVIADDNKLLNVLINLIYNAVDAIESDGIIEIKTQETEENMLKISISDNGCGISEENREKIFNEGYTTKTKGSGLGLYISKEAMKQQYGDLILEKSDLNGTTFEVTIPRI